ncbi:MAG: hypothetical protein Q8L06_09255 [Pseudohongiella sp.]|nr:hypothetical protein [Pseudohongiella sp.]
MRKTMKRAAGVAVTSATLVAVPVMAALPEQVTDVFTEMGTNVGLAMAAAFVLWGLVKGGTTLFKIANKFLSKAV